MPTKYIIDELVLRLNLTQEEEIRELHYKTRRELDNLLESLDD